MALVIGREQKRCQGEGAAIGCGRTDLRFGALKSAGTDPRGLAPFDPGSLGRRRGAPIRGATGPIMRLRQRSVSVRGKVKRCTPRRVLPTNRQLQYQCNERVNAVLFCRHGLM